MLNDRTSEPFHAVERPGRKGEQSEGHPGVEVGVLDQVDVHVPLHTLQRHPLLVAIAVVGVLHLKELVADVVDVALRRVGELEGGTVGVDHQRGIDLGMRHLAGQPRAVE